MTATTHEAGAGSPRETRVEDWPMVIGDAPRDASAASWIEVASPYSREVWARVPIGTDADVDAAVAVAREAFAYGPWARMGATGRAAALRAFARVLDEHVDELTRLQVLENGKAIREQYAQTSALSGFLQYFAGLAEHLCGSTIPVGGEDSFVYTVREPLGVVAALTPWNSPLSLLMWKLAPALAAGNTVVVKPSEVSPVSALRLAQLALEAGIPPGVVNVVTGFGATGAALSAHPGVDKVAFTGATSTGKLVGKAAMEHLARVTLELGGKSANIVFADANLDAAVEGVVGGIFAAAGQTCIAGSRVLVQDTIYDEFCSRLAARAATVKLGDPLDWDTEVGTIASPAQFAKVCDYIDIARGEGAIMLAGPDTDSAGDDEPLVIRPTVFAEVDNDMRIAQEEVFGPVAVLIRFSDDDDAVSIANATRFGLAAGVWTRDVSRAHRMARRLRGGTIWVNTYRRLSYAVPFGGAGDSGIGRENGFEALQEYTELKSVWIDTGGGLSDPFNPMAAAPAPEAS